MTPIRARRWIVALAAVTLSSAAAAEAADPFYEERLAAGIQAAERSDFENAAFELEIACFGFLEEPSLLAQGLVRLALAQARLGDRRAFRATFDRLVEADTRFNAYSTAALDGGLQTQFEQQLVRWVSPETLRALPSFSALADSPEAPSEALSPRQQRKLLVERLRREGDQPDILTSLARLDLDQQKPRRALDWIDRLAPAEQPAAGCLRLEAAAGSGACRARPQAGVCLAPSSNAAAFEVDCLADEGRWPEAAAALVALPLATRARLTRLEKRIRERVGADALSATPSALAEPVEGEVAAATGHEQAGAPTAGEPIPDEPTPGAPSPSAPTPSERVELEALRTRLATVKSLDELQEVRADTAELADQHPGWRAAQLVAAKAAYLASDWQSTVAFLDRAGNPGTGEPQFAFYYAVALFETGRGELAAEVLRLALPRLERNSFVDNYVDRILGPS